MVVLNSILFRDAALRDLPSEKLKSLEACGSTVHFRSGELLFERGKPADRFFLILSGQVTIEAYTAEHGPLVIQKLGPGDLCGTSWIMAPFKWKMDAHAASNVEAVSFYAERVNDLLEKDRELGYAFMKSCFIAISNRLENSQNQLLALLSNRND